jgi:hypothetical protein
MIEVMEYPTPPEPGNSLLAKDNAYGCSAPYVRPQLASSSGPELQKPRGLSVSTYPNSPWDTPWDTPEWPGMRHGVADESGRNTHISSKSSDIGWLPSDQTRWMAVVESGGLYH